LRRVDRLESIRRSGSQNISLARNLAIDTAVGIGEWVAMTEDDCEFSEEWLEALLDAQQADGRRRRSARTVGACPRATRLAH
jgi:succinoglycan biosynthesis protein ExoM